MHELLYLGVFVLVLYLVVRLAVAAMGGLAGTRHRAYRLLAAKYGGRCESRGMSDPPTVSFAHGGTSVRVGLAPTIAGQVPNPRTRVVTRFARGLPLRFELIPHSRPTSAQPPKGTRPVQSGHVEFDRGYRVQANDPDMAREFLDSQSVRTAIEALRRLAPPAGMLISINPERMLVQVDRNLGVHAPLLDQIVRAALILHDGLQSSVTARLSAGIEIMEIGAATAEESGPPVCEVCGDVIVGLHVVCAACNTPCHRDCWTFIGGCSIFGCASKHCVSA